MATDPTAWAAWAHDQAAAEYWAGRIARALNAHLTEHEAERLAADYAASNPGPRAGRSDAELTEAALTFLEGRLPPNPDPLTQVITAVRTDGYLLGAGSATAAIDHGDAGLDHFTPGRTVAAQRHIAQLEATGGLPYAHADAAEHAAQITATHRRRVAKTLALATVAGHAPHLVGAAMTALAAAHAGAVALSELVAAIGVAALYLFRKRQVRTWRWITDPQRNNCARCLANEEQGPIPVGQPFTSGETNTPAHPNCACGMAAA